jgi:predicted RNase H-like HicB family nuclease
MIRTFAAVLRPEEGGWDVEVPEADGSHTWGPTMRKAMSYAREVAAAWFDLPIDDVEMVATVAGVDEVEAARAARSQAEAATTAAAAATHAAMQRLIAAGATERDVAAVLGLSHQRVHQLRSA